LAYDEIEREYQNARDAFTRAASENYGEKVQYVDHRKVVEHLQSVTLQQREISTHGPTPAEALDAAQKKFNRDIFDTLPSLEPCPIAELGGKVRVVTLHSIEEVLLARNVTARWLGQLRNVVTTRDILRGRTIRLKAMEQGELYSADLSAATDYIPHEVAQHVARKLYEKCGAPCTLEALLAMLGPHRLPDGRPTCRGIHMGLGPTWVILSLLNGFAAWHAGAHKDDHRICGDDLIAIWTESRARRYATTLERLGLVVNHSKSFHTEAGVFCERLVRRTGASTAEARDVGHMSTADAARIIAGRTRERLPVAEKLWAYPHFRLLSRETAKRLTPRVRDGGPLKLGGNGRGYASMKQLEATARHGIVRLVRSPYRLPRERIMELRQAESETGDIPVSDLLVTATTRLRLADNFRGRKSKQARPVTSKQFYSQTGSRRSGSEGSKKSLIAAIQTSSLSSKDRKTAIWLIRRPSKLSHHGRRKWLQRAVARPRVDRLVTREFATDWLQSISRVRWELGPSQQKP